MAFLKNIYPGIPIKTTPPRIRITGKTPDGDEKSFLLAEELAEGSVVVSCSLKPNTKPSAVDSTRLVSWASGDLVGFGVGVFVGDGVGVFVGEGVGLTVGAGVGVLVGVGDVAGEGVGEELAAPLVAETKT